MSIEINTGHRKIKYDSGALTITKTSTGRSLSVGLSYNERRTLANALNPDNHLDSYSEAAEARATPAVTHDDVKKVIDEWKLTGQSRGATLADDLWALLSGSDPAVYVVRESDIAAVKVEKIGPRVTCGGQSSRSPGASRIAAQKYLQKAIDCEAMARELESIEAEQAVDPVEEAAVAAFKAAWHRADEEGDEGNRVRRGIRAARHVLGQEASSDE